MTTTQNATEFAAYVKANWRSVCKDANGWYFTSDARWCAAEMRKDGWRVKIGTTTAEADDSFATRFELA